MALVVLGLETGSAFAGSPAAAVWLMDENSGRTMTDSSGNGNDRTIYHVTMTGANGYKFDPGSRSKAVVPNSATLNPGAQHLLLRRQGAVESRAGIGHGLRPPA